MSPRRPSVSVSLDDRAGLLQLLQIDAPRGATLSDAQILRQCYKKWREETPQHVYGDFAFVAWERWSRRTVAATDHLGNFPLFYCRTGGRILFASLTAAASEEAAWATLVAESKPNIRQRMVSNDDLTPLDILPLAHQIAHTPVADPASLLGTWQMTARAARNRVRVILSAEHGSRSIGYAGDLCDSHFVRLRRSAGAAQQIWDRVRCLGMNPRGAHTTMSADETPAGTREEFARAMLTARSPARVDFMMRFGVQWLDPTADRKLIERLLTFPLHVFRVGNRPRGLARELGRGRLPESVRLRRAPATHFTDQTAWFVQRSSDYRRAFQGLRECRVCTEFLDLASLNAMLESLCSGNGTAAQAATVHRALDAGLFAAALAPGPGFGPSPTPPLFESVADMRRICTAR